MSLPPDAGSTPPPTADSAARVPERDTRPTHGLDASAAAAACETLAEASRWAARFEPIVATSAASSKSDASPVTAADLALQALVVLGLRSAGLTDDVVGEESTLIFRGTDGMDLRRRVHELVAMARPGLSAASIDDAIDAGAGDGRATRQWILDPIDGTRGFLRGQQYCVCLAFVEAGRVLFGGAGCPRLGRNGLLVHATRGAGAWANDGLTIDSPMRRLSVRSAPGGTILASESTEASDRARTRLRALAAALAPTFTAVAMESQCKFVLVATGESDLAVRFPPRDPAAKDMVWDYAGAVVITEEAGGSMTDCLGRELRFGRGRAIEGNRGVLCAAAWAHALAVAHCAQVDGAGQRASSTALSADTGRGRGDGRG